MPAIIIIIIIIENKQNVQQHAGFFTVDITEEDSYPAYVETAGWVRHYAWRRNVQTDTREGRSTHRERLHGRGVHAVQRTFRPSYQAARGPIGICTQAEAETGGEGGGGYRREVKVVVEV